MAKKKILDIIYQSDNNYAVVSAISIASLLENNTHLDLINIFYLGHKLKKSNMKKFQSLIERYPNAHITFVDTQKYHDELMKIGVKDWKGLYITWYKMLAFADVDAATDRVLYMNPHTLICGAVDYLLELDFEDNVMALSYDPMINSHKAAIGFKPTDKYFNCGIMLINRKKWLKENIDQQVRDSLSEKSDYAVADQDFCNVFFKEKIKRLGVAYNFSTTYYAYDVKQFLTVNNLKPGYFYSYEEIMTEYYSPKIIHSQFGLTGKPWEIDNDNPVKYLWKKYLNLTPWKDAQLPVATMNLNWRLYRVLPSRLLLALYAYAVNKKFGG